MIGWREVAITFHTIARSTYHDRIATCYSEEYNAYGPCTVTNIITKL